MNGVVVMLGVFVVGLSVLGGWLDWKRNRPP